MDLHRINFGNFTKPEFRQLSNDDPLSPFRRVSYDSEQPWYKKMYLTKRDTAFDNDNAALNAGCLSARKVLYMGVAADCSFVTSYGSEDKARSQILSDWNQASSVYERQINVMLGVIELQIEAMSCPSSPDSSTAWTRDCSDSYTIEQRLSDFSTWRGKKGDDGTGLWHLMTRCAFRPRSRIGLAEHTMHHRVSHTI